MLSIVIPTLNEENYLPRLLDSLQKQSFCNYEIIVADAGSTDRTRELASMYGCKLVQGGNPARGRNEGARHALGDYILFLDADVILPPGFLADLLERVDKKNPAVASGFIYPDSGTVIDRFLALVSNLYCYMIQRLSPHAAGFYILSQKAVHDSINGFNEDLNMAEDHDYVCRASRKGGFIFLSSPKIIFSVRRLDSQGRAGLIWKFFIVELLRLMGKEAKVKVITYDLSRF